MEHQGGKGGRRLGWRLASVIISVRGRVWGRGRTRVWFGVEVEVVEVMIIRRWAHGGHFVFIFWGVERGGVRDED